jgi:hypothetical protein
MKLLSYCSLFMLVMLISFPVSADAFSRRSHHSETAPQSAPLRTTQLTTSQTNTLDASPQAVPEPPVLWLMSLGVGLLAIGALSRRFLGSQSAPR